WTSATYSEEVMLSWVRQAGPATTAPPDATGDDDAPIVEELRRLRKRPDARQLPLLFASLAHASEAVRQRARQALHALGRDDASPAAVALARGGADVGAVLDGLAALEASGRVAALLEQLTAVLKGDARGRAARLHDRKKLALDSPRLAAALRE